jgi:cytochrome b
MAPLGRVPVWDVVVRLLHWALAVLVAVDLVRDDGDYAHRLVGYTAVVVVLARLGEELSFGRTAAWPAFAPRFRNR